MKIQNPDTYTRLPIPIDRQDVRKWPAYARSSFMIGSSIVSWLAILLISGIL